MRKGVVSLFMIALLLTASVVLAACSKGPDDGGETPGEVSVTVNPKTLSLVQGNLGTLTAAVTGSTNQSVTWSVTPASADGTVVSVSGGSVTAIAPGTATVRATAAADTTKYANCSVTVTPVPVGVKGVSLPAKYTLYAGDELQPTPQFDPENATNKQVTWSISEVVPEGSVTLSGGVIKAVSAGGSAKITVTTQDGSKTAESLVSVRIEAKPAGAISTAQDFAKLNDLFKPELSYSPAGAITGDFFLTNDIDFGGATIRPIGGNEYGENDGDPKGKRYYAFNGTFDGRGYALKNFTTSAGGYTISVSGSGAAAVLPSEPTDYSASLFAGTGPDAVIKNLSVINGNILPAGSNVSGVLVGTHRGLIQNCFVSGSIHLSGSENEPWRNGGGVYGKLDTTGKIQDSVFAVKVTGSGFPFGGQIYAGSGAIKNVFVSIDNIARGKGTTEWAGHPNSAWNGTDVITYASEVFLNCSAFTAATVGATNFAARLSADSWVFTSGELPKLKELGAPIAVIAPTGNGFVFEGAELTDAGKDYVFTLTLGTGVTGTPVLTPVIGGTALPAPIAGMQGNGTNGNRYTFTISGTDVTDTIVLGEVTGLDLPII